MAYSYTQAPKEPPEIILAVTANPNGSLQLKGRILFKLRSDFHAAMKNSRYCYTLDGAGLFTLFIKRTQRKSIEESLQIIQECASRLGKRAGVKIILKT